LGPGGRAEAREVMRHMDSDAPPSERGGGDPETLAAAMLADP
jgi:hypothetical protein